MQQRNAERKVVRVRVWAREGTMGRERGEIEWERMVCKGECEAAGGYM